MSAEMLMLSLCLAVAFGGVPIATLIHAHIALARAARHVAEIETLAVAEPQPDISRLGVLELQALAMTAVEELKARNGNEVRGDVRLCSDRRRRRYPPPLAKAG